MATALSVNLNKIALLRNARGSNYPQLLHFAELAIQAGAQGITVHPRPDQRHICVADVQALGEFVHHRNQQPTSEASIELNIEGNPFAQSLSVSGRAQPYPGLMTLIEQARPHQATLVPDSHSQLTSDHGFDLTRDGARLAPIIQQLRQWGVRSSLFMAPDKAQIQQAKAIGADRIELYTGPYADAFQTSATAAKDAWHHYQSAANYAQSIGLGVNAGHDLNLDNLPLFLTIDGIIEVSIGHALTVDALLMGYQHTVAQYRQCCATANDPTP